MSSSIASSSPAPFYMSSVAASTAPSSPSPGDISEPDDSSSSSKPISIEEEDAERRYARLNFVLEKSAMFSAILKARMDQDKETQKAAIANRSTKGSPPTPRLGRQTRHGRKRIHDLSSDEDDAGPAKRMKTDVGKTNHHETQDEEPPIFPQPALVTGAKLKNYQLEGLQWMVSLDQNGISGILADEMGLGKTLQTIAFSAYLRENKMSRPFLVVCPLSVLHNWIEEFARFAPTIPVCMYHGTPAERAELRRTVMLPDESKSGTRGVKQSDKARQKTKSQKNAKTKAKSKPKPRARLTRRSGRFKNVEQELGEDDQKEMESEKEGDDSDEEDQSGPQDTVDDITMDWDENPLAGGPTNDDVASSFPIVITTYEMIIKDRAHLAAYNWGYIVVDEGHRLKNLDCKLMKEIKKYSSAGRMILTGTPLHNNLAELWSLLNFILPDIFNDVDSFQEWFNLPTMQTSLGSERSSQIIDALHAILKPFLLRRLKVDVEANLPPKKEYVLYAPLTIRQREAYDRILGGTLRAYLMGKGVEKNVMKETNARKKDDGPRKLRSGGKMKPRKSYDVDGDDDEYFEMLERGELDARGFRETEKQKQQDVAELGREHQYKATLKQVNNMKLQNTVMQLRKVCSHPFLFDWPLDPNTRQPILNDELVDASGKMMVLDRLLSELFKRKHKVLLFSQFTTMLDIIEDWACEFKGWKICRIDGSTAPLDRRDQMNLFQQGGDAPDAPCLFLLSTRAGGLGINLVAADTVIFYDQDWNPQMDAQAQDRAHRIGQTKPVLIFRLVSAHTIEEKIMQRATEKRKLEALVIAKGKFKMPAAAAGRGKPETVAEMAASLLKLEGEKIDVVPNTEEGKASVLSDEDLEMLLDRRPEVFAGRGKGWTSAGNVRGDGDGMETDTKGTKKKAAFAVYEAPVDEGNEALAKMLGEDVE